MSRFAAPLFAILLLVSACESDSDTTASPAEPSGSGSAPPATTSAAPSASAAPAAGPTMTDESLGGEVAASGLTEPTSLAFIGPDDYFVTEKSTGEVHHVVDGDIGDPVLDLAVNFFDERGLLGIALHPDFAENGYVYLYWTASGEGEGDDGLLGPDTDDEFTLPDLGNRVDRFTWDGEQLTWDQNIVQLRSNTLDTDTSGRIRGNHDAGPILFGTDGKLFVIIGDQNLRGQYQNLADGPAPDDMNFTGMVLRLNDDGSIPDDNPFYDVGAEMGGEVGENVQMTFAYGIRNSFGLAIHPETGDLWETENGDDSWDEVNILPAGSNSGWWQLMGPPERFDEYRQIETDSEDGTDNPDVPPDQLASSADEAQSRFYELDGSAYAAPAFSWKYPVAVTSIALVTDDALGESSTNTAWMGTVLTDSLYRYPLADDGSGFDFGDDEGLSDLVDDNAAKGDVGESANYVVGTGFGVVTHIVQAPDGLLYVSSISNGAVYRIGPADQVGGGGAPGASASASAGASGEVVEITVGTDTGSANAFDPEEISVPAGTTVRLTFVNEATVPHNLTFGDPIDAATATVVQPGAEEVIEFTAPEPGDYTFVCTLHPGMEGTLVVEEAG
ncbi:MAG TPA: PQQ-dependent sugar dehydrogenase [Candidatus Limnocylindria bacterium]|nr:PQQ-dependent sugar dehydrogenase [Candidatus Limnocylindria bacterium]